MYFIVEYQNFIQMYNVVKTVIVKTLLKWLKFTPVNRSA
jgi:hypothetical protein